MHSQSYPKLALTSTVIPSNPEGKYDYDVLGFLIPHEMLRHELARGSKAIINLDSINKKWTADAVCEWLNDFMIPLLNVHHYLEDQIIFPFYLALGMIAPESQEEDHIKLVGRMNKLQSLTRQLIHALNYSNKNSDEALQHIISLEDRIKLEYNDMRDHFLTHFAEEEAFWPELLRKYGEQNWLKVERIIVNYTISFGDHNAGDPLRLVICAIAHSMGIVIGNDALDSEEIPWAGIALQERYIHSRPWIISKMKIKTWNLRYIQFRHLIESVGKSNNSNNSVPVKRNADGKFVARTKKPPIPIILFVFLSCVFCLATMPLFAAVSRPLENLKFLHIKIINYDSPTGSIGNAFNHFIGKVGASSDEIPTFIAESPDVDLDEYEHRVLNGEAWGLIAVNPNASLALSHALANGCQNAASYNPQSAMTFSWDEGRNNIVSDPFIQGFVNGILPQFMAGYAQTQLASLSQAQISQCVTAGFGNLIIQPISYVNNNMTPINVSWVVTEIGLLVGNILMAVFGSMYIVNATYGAITALAEDYGPKGKIFLKAATMSFIGFGVACYYATAMVGMTYHGSSHHLYTGNEWAQVWALQWLHIMIWAFAMGVVMEGFGPAMVPVAFGVLLMWNILGGWNTDIASQGYKHFFQIFPFHWVIYLLRYVFYKSQGYHRGISVGILIAYWVVALSSYLYLGIRNETRIHNGKKIFVYEEAGNPSVENCVDDDAALAKPHTTLGYSGHVVYHIVKNNEKTNHPDDNDINHKQVEMARPQSVEV